jgi:Phosphoglucose isomerase
LAARSHYQHRPDRNSLRKDTTDKEMNNWHLRDLFADDAQRGEQLTAETVGLYLDYSKNRITDETLRLLVKLGDECGLRAHIDAMFRGDKINITENRAVLHVALRHGGHRSSSRAIPYFPGYPLGRLEPDSLDRNRK